MTRKSLESLLEHGFDSLSDWDKLHVTSAMLRYSGY
jgi:hypothetical protein